LVRPGGHSERPDAEAEPDEHGQTMIYSTSARVRGPLLDASGRGRAPRALLVLGGRRMLLPPTGGTIGRSRGCEVVLDDTGVSRRHAEVRPAGDGSWTVSDLGSTNGLLLNGQPVRETRPLHAGDVLGLGSTELTFELG
jgi:FHA domain